MQLARDLHDDLSQSLALLSIELRSRATSASVDLRTEGAELRLTILMKEIADVLHVTDDTVAFHKYTIMERLGLKTSAELVQDAFEHGMLKKRS
jgi:hypothetical protein